MRQVLATLLLAVLATGAAHAQGAPKKPPAIINPPPTAQDYTDLGKLPDWSGVWNPKITDQDAQARTNPPPWNEKVAKEVEKMWAEEKAGRPKLIFYGCFPEAHPSWMLVTHNAMEILFTPGRVTMLGESDGNRLRRIYTDGRPHPDDPDPSFHGHSIGHWEGDTLVVDTVSMRGDTPYDRTGAPHSDEVHLVERMRLVDPDTFENDMTIEDPVAFTRPWHVNRHYRRIPADTFVSDVVCNETQHSPIVNGQTQFVLPNDPPGYVVGPMPVAPKKP
jgi:hypothetical protein